MKIVYDQEVDVPRIIFGASQVQESDEDKPGLSLDYDGYGESPSLKRSLARISRGLRNHR